MKLRVLTLNCWLLPFGMSVDNQLRLGKIISEIKKLKPDIVALQEIWSLGHLNKLRIAFPDYHFYQTNGFLWNKSGLVVMSKFKGKKKSYTYPVTKRYNIIEQFAKKGFIQIRFDKEKFSFINTHMYAAHSKKKRKITMKQFEKLKKNIKNGKTIIAGDFNLRQEDFEIANRDYFQYLESEEITVTNNNKYQTMRWNRLWFREQKVDYIAWRNFKPKKWTEKIISKPILSDHYAVLVDAET